MDVPQRQTALQTEIAKARGLKKVDLLRKLAEVLQHGDQRQALAVATEALELALKLLQVQWKKQRRTADYTDIHQITPDNTHPDYVQRVADSYYTIGICHKLLGEYDSARNPLLKALDLYRLLYDIEKEIGCLETIASICCNSGEFDAALDYCMQGLKFRDQAGPEGTINLLITISQIYCSIPEYEEALSYTHQAQVLMEHTGRYALKGRLLQVRGRICVELSRFDEALDCLLQNLEIRKREGDRLNIITALLYLGNVYNGMGEYYKALQAFREGLQLCEETGYREAEMSLLANVANIYRILGGYESAFEHYSRGLRIAEELSNIHRQATMLEGLGIVYSLWKEGGKALEYMLRSLALFEKSGDRGHVAYGRTNIGMCYKKLGQLDEAWEQFNIALMLCQEIGDRHGEIGPLFNLAEIRLLKQEYEQAEQLCKRALAISEELRSLSPLMGGLCMLGMIYSRQGKFEPALHHLTKALALAEETGQRIWTLEVYKELSALYEKAGDTTEAFRYYKEHHRLEKELFNEQSDDRLRKLQVLHEMEQAEKEKEIYRITTEKLQQENESHKKELASKAMYLSQKNELLEKIRKELRSIARNTPPESVPPVKSLLHDVETAMSEDRAWDVFEEQFQKVHEPFITILTERYPTFTALEVRVCALIRLNLSTKEIARILQVTQRSVETYRYRIRKKLGSDAEENLNSFFMKLR